jgi:hypothetical protein
MSEAVEVELLEDHCCWLRASSFEL